MKLIPLFVFFHCMLFFSLGLEATSLSLKERPLPPRYNQCHFCHPRKNKPFVSELKRPQREHQDKQIEHGRKEMSCHHCHDINNSNYLLSRKGEKASFYNSSPVCKQCHAEQTAAWEKGIHGKRTGEWKSAKIQYHCIDCHNPHSVPFKKMKAFTPPQKSN